jgi:hypothetical protein
MNRIVLGILCGIAFGVIDVLMTVFGNHPERTTGMFAASLLEPLRRWFSGCQRFSASRAECLTGQSGLAILDAILTGEPYDEKHLCARRAAPPRSHGKPPASPSQRVRP